MGSIGALFWLRGRIGRAAFWFWLALIAAGLAIAGFQALSGVGSAAFVVMVLTWCWFALHVNRRHDAGRAAGSGSWRSSPSRRSCSSAPSRSPARS